MKPDRRQTSAIYRTPEWDSIFGRDAIESLLGRHLDI